MNLSPLQSHFKNADWFHDANLLDQDIETWHASMTNQSSKKNSCITYTLQAMMMMTMMIRI